MTPRAYTTRHGRDATPTRERILGAADALVREDAFHAATMEELARRAGVSRATVFTHFRSKLGVLEALNARAMDSPELRAIIEAASIEDPVAALEAMNAAGCEMWDRHGLVLEQLKAIVVLEPAAGLQVEEQHRAQRATLEGIVRRLARAGRLRPGLSESHATTTLHMLTSLESFLELRHEGGLSLRDTTETITALARTLLR